MKTCHGRAIVLVYMVKESTESLGKHHAIRHAPSRVKYLFIRLSQLINGIHNLTINTLQSTDACHYPSILQELESVYRQRDYFSAIVILLQVITQMLILIDRCAAHMTICIYVSSTVCSLLECKPFQRQNIEFQDH